mgnify:CR=1 FL=1
MKNIPGKIAPLVAVAKSNLSGWYVLLGLLFLSVIMSGCEKEPVEGCWEPQTACSIEVTAESIMCGYGAFGNVWLRAADGSYLQPWHNLTEQKELVAGQKYKIAFKAADRDDKYNNAYTCLAAGPAAQAVTITCLSAATIN